MPLGFFFVSATIAFCVEKSARYGAIRLTFNKKRDIITSLIKKNFMRGALGKFSGGTVPEDRLLNYEKESYKVNVYVGNIFRIGFCNYRILTHSDI